MGERPVAVLDANVLIPAGVRDLFLSCADSKLFRPVWQDEILEETRRNAARLLVERNNLTPGQADAAVQHTIGKVMGAFPGAKLESSEWVPLVHKQTCQAKDRHVMAAAVSGKATHLVTKNMRDFPRSSRPAGITVLKPDRFMLKLLKADPDGVVGAVETMCARLKRPSQTPLELTAVLMAGDNVPRFGKGLRDLLLS